MKNPRRPKTTQRNIKTNECFLSGATFDQMAKNRVINTHFWADNYVMDLEPLHKYIFLYLLSNPSTDISGVYEISLKRICFDTGLDENTITSCLTKLQSDGKITFQDGWMIIHNFIKHQAMNPSIRNGILRSIRAAPEWIQDTLSQTVGSLSESVLSNQIKSNVNLKAKNTNLKDPLKDGVSKQKDVTIEEWVNEISPIVGATSSQTVAKGAAWRSVVERAIADGIDRNGFIQSVKAEFERTRDQPHFFTPESVLKVAQSRSTDQGSWTARMQINKEKEAGVGI